MSGLRWTTEQFEAFLAKQRSAKSEPLPEPVRGAASAPERLVRERTIRARKFPEEEIQKQVAEFLDYALPDDFRWWHTPNQRGTRKQWENALLKALGVKAGVQDVTIVGPNPRLIIIEIKAEKGSLSRSQRDWRDFYQSIGVPWFLCRSLDEVIDALESLQVRLKARVI
jgi:hypothetical protein